jgi:2,4-dienoyl-CoA reductase-like NADH-dependent reductase (Old Yellow Enzyme family)
MTGRGRAVPPRTDALSKASIENFSLSGLFKPFAHGALELPSRFVMPGMQRGNCEEGKPPPRMAEYYRRRVEGGVGLIIGEGCCVEHPSSFCEPRFPRLNRATLGGWARCVDAVHEAGGRMLIQISHLGAMRSDSPNLPTLAGPALSPSGLFKAGKTNGRAATRQELADILDAFADAAHLAQVAGADGIELHGCHGFFIDEFLWAETNLRDDEYGGGDLQSRSRYPAEIVTAIRRAVRPGFLISFRFSQWKEPDYGARIAATPEQLQGFLSVMRAAGVDVFHPSTRRFTTPEFPGSDLGLAGWTKALTDAPVIAVGSVGLTQDVMESLVGNAEARFAGEASVRELARRFDNNEFDLIAVGRSLISDPDWVRKIREGRYGDIVVFSKADLRDSLEERALTRK